MSLQFSKKGPAFPEQLVDALMSGNVVFFCGAGVSAPYLPLFDGLVEECAQRLRLEKNASENESFESKRYEEVLGSLSRRTVDAGDVTREVVNILKERSEHASLANHHTVLKLSRSLDNRPTIVTTNFDTLLERALQELEGPERAQALSFAGQDLPPPGSTAFGGIIHLHGRMADEAIGLKHTPLVITSADYGDAYMRSGWASRFLFDLCRCKTVVLLGYRAGDAPVRYFLNVLEADRQRFADVLPVYAFNGVLDRDAPDKSWAPLAVDPISYEVDVKVNGGSSDHGVLWRDLEQLAELIAKPRSTRTLWAKDILVKDFEKTDGAEQDRIVWLLKGRNDLYPLVISTIEDTYWFDFLLNQKVWAEQDTAWILAQWVAKDLESTKKFKFSITWLQKLGRPFSSALIRNVEQAKNLSDLWYKAWRLFVASQHPNLNYDFESYALRNILRGAALLNSDLSKAVDLISPAFKLVARDIPEGESARRLADITGFEWETKESGESVELIDVLVSLKVPDSILALATAKLQEVVAYAYDLDAIDDDFDRTDYAVPSVEQHDQNEYHEGPIFLVQLLARLIPAAAALDKERTRAVVSSWRTLPGLLGHRLWLHALRDKSLFTSDEALIELIELPIHIFWKIRRELALAIRDRCENASLPLVAAIEHRVLNEGLTYFERYFIEKDQADWRGHARDSAVWLRLNMLKAAGVLSNLGIAELKAIKRKRDYLDREVEEQDFFGAYSFGVRAVVPDVKPIIEADEHSRLEIARQSLQSPNIKNQLGWAAYCGADPDGAFDTLSNAPLDHSNVPLWKALIRSLAFQQGTGTGRNTLMVNIFEVLQPAPEDFLASLVGELADLYFNSPRKSEPSISGWWSRLLVIAAKQDKEPYDISQSLEEATISSAGRLTLALLMDIEHLQKEDKTIAEDLLGNLNQAALLVGRQGLFSRCVLLHYASFVLAVPNQAVAENLNSALTGESDEARALRRSLLSGPNNSPKITQTFGDKILQGISEIGLHQRGVRAAATKILRPALSILRGEHDADFWGITLEQAELALKDGSPLLRIEALKVLTSWITQMDTSPAEAWHKGVGPFLARWSRDRALREEGLTPHFVTLAASTGNAFPAAVTQLLPYLTALQSPSSLHSIESSTIPDTFPRDTLTLLWRLYGPDSTRSASGIPGVLDRMVKVDPSLQLDRRLQWLDQTTVRYD